MSRFFLIISLFISFTASAQRTKMITNTIKDNSGSNLYTEQYKVFKDDGTTMHGSYKKFNRSGKTSVAGYYKNGMKDSLWTEYDSWDGSIGNQGYYSHNKRVGIWTFNKDEDTVEFKYDFDNNKVVYLRQDTSKRFSIILGNDTITTIMQQPPLYLGGRISINNAIINNIHYPDEARENNIEGRVLVAFTVDTDGHASLPWIKKGVDKTIDDEALRVASKISDDWVPGKIDGNAVVSIYVMPISFKLE
ncbi:MAG: hypothetical protein JWQ38_1605 [Flavipsychrobacter sp.]|nr:hypothetical protein [Flavipsychrobacter sp.]